MGQDIIVISSDDEGDILRAAPARVRKSSASLPGGRSGGSSTAHPSEVAATTPDRGGPATITPPVSMAALAETGEFPGPAPNLGRYPPRAGLPASFPAPASTAPPGLDVMVKTGPSIPPEASPPNKREPSVPPAVSPPVALVPTEPAVPEDPLAPNTEADDALQARPPAADGSASVAGDVAPPAMDGQASTTRAVAPTSIQAAPMDEDKQAAPEITAPDATRATSPTAPVLVSCADQDDQAALAMSPQGPMDETSPTAIPSPAPNPPAPDIEAEAHAEAEAHDGQPAPATPTQAVEFIPTETLDSFAPPVSAADTIMEDVNLASGTPPPPVDESAPATAPVEKPATSDQGSPAELPTLAPAPVLSVETCDIQPALPPAREATPTTTTTPAPAPAPAVTSALEVPSPETPTPAPTGPDPAVSTSPAPATPEQVVSTSLAPAGPDLVVSTSPASKSPGPTASVAPEILSAPVPAVPTPAFGSAASGLNARELLKSRKAASATTDPAAEASLDAETSGPATPPKNATEATAPPSPENPPEQGAKSSVHRITVPPTKPAPLTRIPSTSTPVAPTVPAKPPSSPPTRRPTAPRGENPVIAVDRLLREFSFEVTETITGAASKAHFQLSLKKEIERFSASLAAARPQLILLSSPAAEDEEFKVWQAFARSRSVPLDDDEMDRDDEMDIDDEMVGDDPPTPMSARGELTAPPSRGRKRKVTSAVDINPPRPSPPTSAAASKRLKAEATFRMPVSPQRDRPHNGYSLPRVCQIVDAVSTGGLPNQVSPDAVRTLTLSALSAWRPKFSTFTSTLFTLVGDMLRSVFTTHFLPYKYTLLFARTRALLESFLSRCFSMTQTHLNLLLTLETRNVRTSLDPDSFRKLVDEKRSAVLSARLRNLEVQYPRKPRMPSPRRPAHDRYSRELEVIAEALAYHDIARQRFVDYLGLFIAGEFLEGIREGILGELRQELGLESAEAEEKCSVLLEPELIAPKSTTK